MTTPWSLHRRLQLRVTATKQNTGELDLVGVWRMPLFEIILFKPTYVVDVSQRQLDCLSIKLTVFIIITVNLVLDRHLKG